MSAHPLHDPFARLRDAALPAFGTADAISTTYCRCLCTTATAGACPPDAPALRPATHEEKFP